MENEKQEVVSQINKQKNDFNVMRIRLDTDPLLKDIEEYLRGARFIFNSDEQGNTQTIRVNFGIPKCNEKGIQSIMNWLKLIINPQTVQGNFVQRNGGDDFKDFMFFFQVDFGNYIMLNIYDFDIDDNEYEGLIRSIVAAVQRFLSRSISNEERKSYSETTRSVESNIQRSGGGGLGIFKTQ